MGVCKQVAAGRERDEVGARLRGNGGGAGELGCALAPGPLSESELGLSKCSSDSGFARMTTYRSEGPESQLVLNLDFDSIFAGH